MWAHKDLETELQQEYRMIIPPHGIAVYKIEAENCGAEHNLCAETAINFEGLQDTAFLTDAQAKQLLCGGAILVDVRESFEYEEGHLENAINIPYTGIHAEAAVYLKDKKVPVIVYCRTGKWCAQAKQSLIYLGYEKVYDWKVEI